MSASIPHVRNFLDRNLPGLSSIMSGKVAGKEAGDNVRRLFIRSFAANAIALGFWAGSLVMRNRLPPMATFAELTHHAANATAPVVAHMTAAQFVASQSGSIAMLSFSLGAVGTSIVAAKRDYAFLKAAFGAVQASVTGPNSEENLGFRRGILATLSQRAQITLVGFRMDRSLRNKMIACSAVELCSDVMDTYASATRNTLVWAGSTAISETVGLKILDLTLRAYRTGLVADEAGTDIPASVRLLQSIGCKEKAEVIMAELSGRPRLAKFLKQADSAALSGAAAIPAIATRNCAEYAMTGDLHFLSRGTKLVGLGVAVAGASAATSGAILGYIYANRKRPLHTAMEAG